MLLASERRPDARQPRRRSCMLGSHPLGKRAVATLIGVALAAGGAAACGGDDNEQHTVALLLPESKTARYEARDRPTFEAALKRDLPEFELLYSNADQDAAKQQAQAEA